MTIGEWLKREYPAARNPTAIIINDNPPAILNGWMEVGIGWLQKRLPVTFVALKLEGAKFCEREAYDVLSWESGLSWESESRLLATEVLDL